ncbi:APO protein 2, chloroplastic, partial [Sesamum angolense]
MEIQPLLFPLYTEWILGVCIPSFAEAFLRSKGTNPCSKFDLLGHGTWQGLSSLDSFKVYPQQEEDEIKAFHLINLTVAIDSAVNEKKPFPIPIVELRRAARERLKNRKNQPRGVPPPKRGLVVERLIPVAYKTIVSNDCSGRWCSEIHVGPVGHPFKSCRGPQASIRKGAHEWVEAVVEDMLVPVEAIT